MCTDYHYDNEEELIEAACLLEDRIIYLEFNAEFEGVTKELQNDINSLNEAYSRDCWCHGPYFPGEE